MATNRAQTGTIAATAGASSGGLAANVEAGNAATGANADGSADIATNNGATSDLKTDEKHPEVAEKAKELIDSALDAAKNDQLTAIVGETTKIKVLKAHPELGAFAGDTTTIPTELATRLAASGHVVEVSSDGKAIVHVYGTPTTAQLQAASTAYGRFLAAGGETELTEFASPTFADLPAEMQRCFVAAIDPTYGPLA